ncbi:MAG TPA: hypothetical protein VF985_06340, partial [Mariniflexile sp.]
MKFTLNLFIFIVPFFVCSCQQAVTNRGKSPEALTETLLSKLSLDQKIDLVVGMGLPGDEGLV